MMADRGTAIGTGASPVSASCLDRVTGGYCAVELRAGQDIVTVGSVASSVDDFAFFSERRLLTELVFVTVQIGHVVRYTDAFGVVPRALANAVSGIDRRLTIGSDCAEIGAPGMVAGPRSCGQIVAMPVGSGHPPEIRSIARTLAGDEESHGVLRQKQVQAGKRQHERAKNKSLVSHSQFSLLCFYHDRAMIDYLFPVARVSQDSSRDPDCPVARGDAIRGLDQVNVLLPRALAGTGVANIVLSAEGKAANTVYVSIK